MAQTEDNKQKRKLLIKKFARGALTKSLPQNALN